MRTLLTIMLTCFISLSTAQDNVGSKEMVGFGCYAGGRSTAAVMKVEKLLRSKSYKEISKLLTSRNYGEKYLAVISLQRLADLGYYNLSDNEKDLIAKAKQSNDLVLVCSGCTYSDKVPMKSILAEDNFIGSKYWLDKSINRQ